MLSLQLKAQTHHALSDWQPRYRPVSNKRRWLQTYVFDWQPTAANVSRWQRSCVHHTISAVFYTFVC